MSTPIRDNSTKLIHEPNDGGSPSNDSELQPYVLTNPAAPMHEVDGKVAFITGGDSGIGLGIAHACVNAGMKVVITYRSTTHRDHALAALQIGGNRVHAIKLDVTDRAAMSAAVTETLRVFGKIHVLINNAGVVSMVPLSSSTFDDWHWCMDVNLNGVFNGVHAFLPYLKAHGEGGQVVATSSMLGGMVAGPLWGAYSAAKFAVVGMMEALRSELSGTNIGVSIFCPAGVTSNLGNSARNRPGNLSDAGVPAPEVRCLIDDLDKAVIRIVEEYGQGDFLMNPLEAGARALQGIRNNDLYIFSHPEYEDLLRDRLNALLVSHPKGNMAIPAARIAMAKVFHNPIYRDEVERKVGSRSSA